MAEAIVPAGAPTPVMDVVAPPAEKETKPSAPAEVDPVDALAAADQRTQQAATDHTTDHVDHKTDHKAANPAKPAQHAPAKPKEDTGNGVGMAIVATVIIVFGLAILAVYAYIQTNK
jgi:hypothetical protein